MLVILLAPDFRVMAFKAAITRRSRIFHDRDAFVTIFLRFIERYVLYIAGPFAS